MTALPRLTDTDLHARCAELLDSAVTVDVDGDVSTIDVARARQALELARGAGLDLAALLDAHRWFYYPRLLLSVAVEGADHSRETRLHAVWCARQVRHLWPEAARPVLRAALLTAWRYACGRAAEAARTAQQRRLIARTVAHAVADGVAHAAAAYAAAHAVADGVAHAAAASDAAADAAAYAAAAHAVADGVAHAAAASDAAADAAAYAATYAATYAAARTATYAAARTAQQRRLIARTVALLRSASHPTGKEHP